MVATGMTPAQALGAIWREAAMPDEPLGWLALSGVDPALPSSFRVGTAAQVSIALAAVAAAQLWHMRTGRAQHVAVDMHHAAVEFRSERHLAIDGAPAPPEWDAIAGLYRAGGGGWVRLHTNFPHHREGVLRLLQCVPERAAVQGALANWSALAFEQAAGEAGLCVTALRSCAEWDAHPQGRAVATLPLVEITRIGAAPPRPLPVGDRPLAGVRVLDLTRIIAGPVAGRTLAAHGADVLLITSPHLPSIPALVMDTGRGKLSAHLDLELAEDRDRLSALLGDADVLLQAYRPGALVDRGFGPETCARIRPGLIYASLSAYGRVGPWAGRRGFDSLVQTASGFNHAEAEAAGSDKPKPLPVQALDHASGYICWRSVSWPRCGAAPSRAEAGMSAYLWRAPGYGCASSAASTGSDAGSRWLMVCCKPRLPASAA